MYLSSILLSRTSDPPAYIPGLAGEMKATSGWECRSSLGVLVKWAWGYYAQTDSDPDSLLLKKGFFLIPKPLCSRIHHFSRPPTALQCTSVQSNAPVLMFVERMTSNLDEKLLKPRVGV